MHEATMVLNAVGKKAGVEFALTEALVGGSSIDASGVPLTDEVLKLTLLSDAVLLGAVGGTKWEALDYSIRPERALLALRKELGLFANLRPARIYKDLIDASTLKPEVIDGVDLIVVRELTGGLYFGTPKGVEKLPDGTERGVNTMVYTTPEIERIAKVGFEVARKRRKKLLSVDKANVLETTELWRRVVIKIGRDYPDVELSHMYVDNCAMQLVRNPRQFDVIVTENTFGDILSDEASMLTGSIGMLPSASLGATKNRAMYEPIHGSAPDIAGKGIANPIATILSVAMMLKYSFEMEDASNAIETAVEKVLGKGFRTADIYQPGTKKASCSEMGEAVLKEL
ncbi:MAG: 3-isopropylmalate dehydrogenase [Deltaproteobacteria bacterium GWB2_55_19]|nr:MAG: 3-isopropylmalate dehydrogenase [Deltaproteobacteria bacterium GWB2_55_19]HAO92468.1 3-isopropylmalate dehydrogenase [Deltaproteobacteria bacterium]